MKPKLVIKPMARWQAFILKIIGFFIGLRGRPYFCFVEDEAETEMTINDVRRMQEEDEMNTKVDKETGE